MSGNAARTAHHVARWTHDECGGLSLPLHSVA